MRSTLLSFVPPTHPPPWIYINTGVGPVAILLGVADVNIAIGAMVAERLYERAIPVLAVAAEDYPRLRTGDEVAITLDGVVSGACKSRGA